jgi:hypothetical protein
MRRACKRVISQRLGEFGQQLAQYIGWLGV